MRGIMMLFLGLCLAGTLEAQEKAPAYPVGADTTRYPIISDTTGHVAKMVEMGLHLSTLSSDWTGHNWYEKWHGYTLRRFVYETLSTGTSVWVDTEGRPWYKADCVNRLATQEECRDCPTLTPGQLNVIFPETLRISGDLEVTHYIDDEMRDLFLRGIQGLEENRTVVASGRPGWFSRHKTAVLVVGSALVGGGIYCLLECRGDTNITNIIRGSR